MFYTETMDPKRAREYEQSVKWWKEFKTDQSPVLTEKQVACIYAIRKHNPEAHEFTGSSVNEASEYISRWG